MYQALGIQVLVFIKLNLGQGSANYPPRRQIQLLVCFCNKVFLERGPVPLLSVASVVLSCYNERLEPLLQRLYGSESLKYLLPDSFQKKFAKP